MKYDKKLVDKLMSTITANKLERVIRSKCQYRIYFGTPAQKKKKNAKERLKRQQLKNQNI